MELIFLSWNSYVKSKNILWKYLLLKINNIFLRDSYVCLRCIFIFDSDQAQINSVQDKQLQERLHYMSLVTEHISRSPVTDYASSFSNTLPVTECISSYSPHLQLHYTPPVTGTPPITRTTAVSVLHLLLQWYANVNRSFSSFNYISNNVLRL